MDELDRCRPTYAIEMLEVIKHFFSVDKLVFVVATDTDQLSHSIKAVYGEGFDADNYLRRFFQQRAKLPAPDLMQYILAKYSEKDFTRGNSDHLFGMQWQFIVTVFADSALAKNLSIRSLNNILLRAKAIMRQLQDCCQSSIKPVCLLVLFLGLLEYEKDRDNFYGRGENNHTDLPVSVKGPQAPYRTKYIINILSDLIWPKKDKFSEFKKYYYSVKDPSPSIQLNDNEIWGRLSNEPAKPLVTEAELKFLEETQIWIDDFQKKHVEKDPMTIFIQWSDYKKMIELSDVLTL